MSSVASAVSVAANSQTRPRERILAAASDLFYRNGIRAVGVDAPPSYGPARAGDALRSVLDTTKSSAELGFTAAVALAEGIAATAAAT